ncbi:uncharacterized protein LOC122081704 [Macadamia integrifolia]|uniref:uncharacterized protein LOC122081704 n=1 Tax=Macadamia integrifolia TaxID=60698 RepID=UPI001C4F7D30|nr:uncharacterized protein LOC122081704 [Macadamia integrifolia]
MVERGLFLELMTSMFLLVTAPFLFFKSICLFGVRTVFLAVHTWILLVKAIIIFQVSICCKVMIWTIALISLPLRILNALHRERLLEAHLHELQYHFENLVWDKMEAEEMLQLALKDCRILETMLSELEEEHEKALAKIELLENELQDLKDENFRWNEVQGKGLWDFKPRDVPAGCTDVLDVKDSIPLETKYGVQSLKPGNGSGVILQELMMHRDAWEDEIKGKTQSPDFLEIGPRVVPTSLMVDEVLDHRKGVALSQSIFSAILSLLVGMIIWEAADPCIPLVVALFTVVGISLKSVVRFFSTINNSPASDAVALLSFNWFILGMLTYPALPRVTRMLAPHAVNLMNRVFGWFGHSAS